MVTVLTHPAEARVVLHDVSWHLYEQLLAEHDGTGNPRFVYDRGELEIMVLSFEHEELNRTLALLVDLVAAELNINVRRAGSNTFKREDLLRGFEPDSCFYIKNAGAVKGKKRIELPYDPPPDLVIEIDISSPSLPPFPIFAAVGVPEVWRYDGERVRVFKLEEADYVETDYSISLPPLSGATVTSFLKESAEMESADWMRSVREWARKQIS